MAAYSHQVKALSWVHEYFSWKQSVPPDCRILVMVEPPMWVRDCLFVRENPIPANCAAITFISRGRSTIRHLMDAGDSSYSSAPPPKTMQCRKYLTVFLNFPSPFTVVFDEIRYLGIFIVRNLNALPTMLSAHSTGQQMEFLVKWVDFHPRKLSFS